MRSYTIKLPLPDRKLNPHAKGLWRVKAKATKDARLLACVSTLFVTGPCKPMLEKAIVQVIYDVSPDKKDKGYRPKDVQNAISCLKAYIDGCVDAGLIVDDSAKHLAWGSCEIVRDGKAGVTLMFREVGN